MIIETPSTSMTYRLLDSGNGFRLEQWGPNTIIRPDSSCVWAPSMSPGSWKEIEAEYRKTQDGTWTWRTTGTFQEQWTFSCNLPIKKSQERQSKITCSLRFASSKNIGVFPEQASQWEWMASTIRNVPFSPNVLNLFGYTGAATLAAAAAGASVCHVDASQAAVSWARNNQALSHLEKAPIRWIVDDCSKFVAREVKRGMSYDGLIIDPPPFGRDHKGNVFEFEKRIRQLLGLCKQVLRERPLFVIFNGYSMGHSATVIRNLLEDIFPHANIEYGELHLEEQSRHRTIPCSIFARFNSINT